MYRGKNTVGSAPLRRDYPLELLCRHLQAIVDDEIIIPVGFPDFPFGIPNPTFNNLCGIKVTPGQPPTQFFNPGGEDEDEHRPGAGFLELGSPLAVDVEDHIKPLGTPPFKGLPGGAVTVAMNLGPLDELTGGNHPSELLGGNEEVIHAILLTDTGRTSCKTDRLPQLGEEVNYFLTQAGLSRT